MSFSVNGVLWQIIFVSADSPALEKWDGSRTAAVTDNNIKTVFLSENLYGDFLWTVLCHEIVHVFCFEYNILLSIDLEEKLADFISNFGNEIIYLTEAIFMALKRGMV